MIGSRPAPSFTRRPPLCEVCGYDLTGAVMAGRCPECGESVAGSIDPDLRRGAAWERRRRLGRWKAWGMCGVDGIRNPGGLGRSVRLADSSQACPSFLAIELAAIFIVVGVCVAGYWWAFWSWQYRSIHRDYQFLLGAVPLLSLASTIVALLLVGAAAWIAAIWHRRRAERNLLPASIQIAAYFSTLLVAAAGIGVLTALVIIENDGIFRELRHATGIDREVLAFLTWCACVGAPIVFYFIRVVQATAAARFANR